MLRKGQIIVAERKFGGSEHGTTDESTGTQYGSGAWEEATGRIAPLVGSRNRQCWNDRPVITQTMIVRVQIEVSAVLLYKTELDVNCIS